MMNAAMHPATVDLAAELALVLGPEAVVTGAAIPERHLADWSGVAPVRPLALVRPRTTQQVAAVLALCHARGVPVVPQGGMTGLAGAATPHAQGIALSLERMTAIEDVDTAGATLRVQAGATLQVVQEAAEAAGLAFGVDLGARGSCTIGGNLATNAGGNGVLQFGMMREQCLGLEVVLADGRVLDMLRPMIKNNTGYDLKHWFIGAEGTLGVITRALLRLRPGAGARATALVALDDDAQALALLARLQAAFPGTLSAFELMWQDFLATSCGWAGVGSPFGSGGSGGNGSLPPLAALVDVSGDTPAHLAQRLEAVLGAALEDGQIADAVLAGSQAQARALWRLREATAEFPTRLQPLNFDVSLPLARIADYAERCRVAIHARWPQALVLRFGHLGDGNLHLTVDLRTLGLGEDGAAVAAAAHAIEAIVYGLLGEMGGSLSAEHGIGLHKKPWLGVSRSPEELAAMRAIKLALDPRGILNPGKVFELAG